MSHMIVQAQAIDIINRKMVKKEDLPSEYNALAFKWLINSHQSLLDNEYKEFWIIEKTTTSSSNYNLFCGRNVYWRNTAFNIPDKIPNVIIVIENSEFKGIIIGGAIIELIQLGIYGIFLWLSDDNKPTFIVANTIKGKGISFMENAPEWHHKSPDDEQLKAILEELAN